MRIIPSHLTRRQQSVSLPFHLPSFLREVTFITSCTPPPSPLFFTCSPGCFVSITLTRRLRPPHRTPPHLDEGDLRMLHCIFHSFCTALQRHSSLCVFIGGSGAKEA
eukprot:Sspe_Gene.110273::Locus_90700_Transcript_1_1_Confidence_1.000_Length_463::g.110273::m.110273